MVFFLHLCRESSGCPVADSRDWNCKVEIVIRLKFRAQHWITLVQPRLEPECEVYLLSLWPAQKLTRPWLILDALQPIPFPCRYHPGWDLCLLLENACGTQNLKHPCFCCYCSLSSTVPAQRPSHLPCNSAMSAPLPPAPSLSSFSVSWWSGLPNENQPSKPVHPLVLGLEQCPAARGTFSNSGFRSAFFKCCSSNVSLLVTHFMICMLTKLSGPSRAEFYLPKVQHDTCHITDLLIFESPVN